MMSACDLHDRPGSGRSHCTRQILTGTQVQKMGSTIMASTGVGSSEPSTEPRLAPREAVPAETKDGLAAARADQGAHPDHDAAPTTGTPPGASPPHPWRKRLLWAVAVIGLAFGGYRLVPV